MLQLCTRISSLAAAWHGLHSEQLMLIQMVFHIVQCWTEEQPTARILPVPQNCFTEKLHCRAHGLASRLLGLPRNAASSSSAPMAVHCAGPGTSTSCCTMSRYSALPVVRCLAHFAHPGSSCSQRIAACCLSPHQILEASSKTVMLRMASRHACMQTPSASAVCCVTCRTR